MIEGKETLQTSGDYGVYTELLAPYNANFPQRQGLFEDEYVAAIDDPLVVCTVAETSSGDRVSIPRIAPVDTYSWLNAETYKDRFPAEYGRDAVRHFFDLPSLHGVNEREEEELHRIAREKGVLVFDYPDIDVTYKDRVISMLSGLGIPCGEVEILGTQTYFAGKVKLKAGYDPALPIKGLHESFKGMIRDGLIGHESYIDGASYVQNIHADDAERMYPRYESAFQILNTHPCRQGLTPAEFMDVMTNDPETAKLRFSVGGQTATLMILGDNLGKYDWINPEFFAGKYPIEYAARQILYFPALYTDTEMQGEANSEHVVNLIAQMVEYGNNEIIVAFDCCDINVGFLDAYIEALVNATPQASISFSNLGAQQYAAVRLG